ncbi:flagellar hook-associated protein FlgK [Desulfobotulus sp.]|uniref:flagellar hook-associated protein FlgK n=1 Tax=Desulfobotulus sp. TaxID=1940337 RepID=UPI002A362DFF|nr:flagellar hook-associated protein FlgK [Desulfobotulus sp.]MDY0164394.1 flagellar hook-associated protein FlgK [Desulfobotulus sp.]
MAGINHTLNIARQGLSAQQLGLNVTGHNIANVNNPDFSRQSVPQAANAPISQSGFLIGSGVSSQQIRQTADQLLEDRIATQQSAYSASEAFMAYMKTLGNMFNESSETSMSRLLPEFWDSWNTLANNPGGAAERMNVYENGMKLTERFNLMDQDLWNLEQDLNKDIQAGIGEVNRITSEIARLNQAIMGQETSRTSNDNRDLRNSLLKELSQWVDIKNFEGSNGAITVTTAGGFSLVSGTSSYALKFEGNQVKWQSSSGGYVDITARIEGGALGGWLEMRDVELPRYRQEMDALARETIWNVNRLHSQGAGTQYITGSLNGSYAPQKSNWLATLPYGDRVDYTKDFGLWVENKGSSPSTYAQSVVDMGLSSAQPQGWTGSAPDLESVRYDFTVVRSGTTGESLWLADGENLASVQTAESMDAALTQAIRRQTLTITDGNGQVQTLEVGQTQGMVAPSAAAIAAALNGVDGLQAYSLPNQMTLDIAGLLPGVAGMEAFDEVRFTLASGSIREEVVFRVGSDDATTRANFENALRAVVDGASDLTLDHDAMADPNVFVLKSHAGENLGIGDFQVVDNARITLDNFVEDGGGPGSATFTLGGVEITFQLVADQSLSAGNLVAALNRESSALKAQGISWALNGAGTGVEIWGSGGKALDLTDLATHGGSEDGGFTLTGASGTLVNGVDSGSIVLTAPSGGGASGAGVAPDVLGAGALAADGALLVSGGVDSAVKTSSLTIFAAPGMTLATDAQPGFGSLFSGAANLPVPSGNAVLTLGGDGGFGGFNAGDTVSFVVDGMQVSYAVDAAHTQDKDFADELVNALKAAGLDPALYRITQTGAAVSILRTDGEAIRLADFDDTTGDASLRVVTGSGFGLEGPATVLLESGGLRSAESAVFGTGAAVEWRKYDADGQYTGVSGRIDVRDSGPYGVEGDLAFQFSPGTLVAGNTFSVNTDENGRVSHLDMTVKGRAGSVNDSYVFTVKPPGGALGEETVTLMWESRYGHGEVTVEVDSRTKPPIYVEVDGMRLGFESGMLFKNDIFIIETDAAGNGSLMRASDWHWTTDSFAAQFNRQSEGVTAKVLADGSLSFTTQSPTFEISDVGCSGVNGFCDVNTQVRVLDATALSEEALDFRLARDGSGNWSIQNDYTYGVAQLVPPGGHDSGFGIDLTGNGLADIHLSFDQPVTGSGHVEFDILKRNPEHYGFAFSGDAAHDSGLAAALGLNTFFTGTDAKTMEVNGRLAELKNINAGSLDPATGELRKGDNSMARALSDLQDVTIRFEEWRFSRNGKAVSAQADASLEGYYQMMVSSLGVRYQTEQRSLSFYAVMMSNLGQQRDSLSAVSLDEEMVNLIKYQQAFTAAAKLITVSDEMLSTLVNMR